jgi:subtilisin-like proprotein convertase family protein
MKHRNVIFITVLVSATLYGGTVLGQDAGTAYFSTDTPIQMPEYGTIASTLVVSDSGLIVDLKVVLNISHESVDQLEAYLIGPDGTRVKLFDRVGDGGSDFINTLFDDRAETLIGDGEAPFTGQYRPEGNLSDFDFKELKGTWTLEIKDDKSGDSGILESWGLQEVMTITSNIIFEDTFPSATISPVNWPQVNGATVDDVGIDIPSPYYCLRLNDDPSPGDSIQSRAINLSGGLEAILTYDYQRVAPCYPPDIQGEGGDLIFEGLGSSGWVELDRQLGSQRWMTYFAQAAVTLPSDMLQRNFQLRIRQGDGSLGSYGEWLVDNVKIVLNNLESPGVVSNPSFEGQTWGWTTKQAFSSSLWHSNGSYSARIFTIPDMTQEAGTWVGLAQSIDLSNIAAIKFDASTTASSGGTWENCAASVYIDDTEVWSDAGPDKTWLNVQVDTTEYTGVHTLSLRLSFLKTGNFDEDVNFDNIRTYLAD